MSAGLNGPCTSDVSPGFELNWPPRSRPALESDPPPFVETLNTWSSGMPSLSTGTVGASGVTVTWPGTPPPLVVLPDIDAPTVPGVPVSVIDWLNRNDTLSAAPV